MLDYPKRKQRLPFGAVTRVSETVGCAKSTVHEVLKGTARNHQVEILLAGYMKPRTSRQEAFGPAAPGSMRRTRAETKAAS